MKENKNFKRLVIFVIVATMCLSALALLPTASADCPEDCPSGMISYWKLDETSSGPVEDCYGPNDAVNNGATINQPGQVGTAYSFNGAGDYILAPSLDSQIDDTLTIAAWLYNDESTPGATNCYFRIVGLLHLRRGSGVWDLAGEGGMSFQKFNWDFDNHQQEWHYHVVTLDVSGSPPYEVRAFVDGVEEPGSPFSIAAKSTATYTNTYIGQFSSSYSWEGSIDEVAIYNRTLSASEISSQYYAGLAGYGYCNTSIIPPVADANGPYEDNDCDDDYTITFDGSGSIAPGGTIVSYDWDFGDGTGWHNDIGATPSYTYPNFGEYTVTLRVTDNDGLTDMDTSTANVYCPPDCPSGMISYWKLDETSSGPVEDCYGPNDAVNNGATINQPGQVGTAYGFNGAGDYIQAPSLDSQIDDTLTIAAWLYNDESTPGVTNAYFRIVGLLHLRRGSGVWDLDGEGGLSDVQFSWNFDNHQQEWHYHVVTLNVSGSPPYEVRAFVDGVEEPGSPFSIAAKSTATYTYTYIGQASSSYSWEGSIDEVAIYNRVLSASEILSQYYTGLDGFGYCYSKPVADANGPYEDDNCDYIIDFDGSGSNDPDGTIVTYDWDFGDGTGWHNDLGEAPSYTFSDFGDYTVTLRVTESGNGCSDTDTSTAEVYGVIADANGPYEDTDCDVDYTIIFDGSGSTGYQMPLTYDWDFGDGTGWHNDLGEAPSYTFSDFGDYTVTLRVTESGNGCSDTDTSTAEVYGVIADANGPYEDTDCDVDYTIIFDGSGSTGYQMPLTYDWDFGDGTGWHNDLGEAPSYTFSDFGDYTVTLRVTESGNGCSDTDTSTAEVYGVIADANGPYEDTDCDVDYTIIFDGSGSTGYQMPLTYDWDFGDGTGWHNDLGEAPSYTFSDFGDYTVTLRVTESGNGCSDTDTSTAEVYGVIADANGPYEDTDCDVDYTIIFDGSGSTGYQMPLTYDWDFGDGTGWHNDLGEAPSYTFSDFGDYTVTLRVTESGNGCSDTDTSTAEVYGVIADANGPYEDTDCDVDYTIIFDGSGSTGYQMPLTYDWDFGDGTGWHNDLGEAPSYTFSDFGDYTVTLRVTESGNGCSDTDTSTAEVYGVIADANGPYEDTDCDVDYTIIFDGSGSTGYQMPLTYDWDFGDGTGWHNDLGEAPSYTFSDFGDYTVTLRVTESGNGCSDTDTSTAEVYGVIADANGPYEDTDCDVDYTIIFDGSGSTGYQMPLTYDWDFGDGTGWHNDLGEAPSYTFSDFGDYTVTLRVTESGNGCSDTDTSTAEVYGVIADANGPYEDTDCDVDYTIIFDGSGSTGYQMPLTYDWDFGDGTGWHNDLGEAPSYTFSDFGDYTVTLRVTESGNGCSDTDTSTAEVYGVIADANGPYEDTDCDVDYTIIFDGSGSTGYQMPLTYDWDFGDGTGWHNDLGEAPSYTFSDFGDYTVTLRVTESGNGCSDTDTSTAEVYGVIADANGPYSGTTDCRYVQFSGSASGGYTPYSWDWDFGDGSSHSSEQNPSHMYTSAGDYTATLTVTDDNSNTDSDTASVDIDDVGPLNTDAGGPYTGTICSPVKFSGSVTGGCPSYSWDWDFGDGSSHSYVQNPSHQYSANGQYTVTLIVTDSFADTDSDTVSVTISTSSVSANAHGPYYSTPGDTIQLSGSASGGCSPYSWDWDFGDGSSHSYVQNPSHSYAEGDYTVTLTVTGSKGKSDSDTTQAHVHSGVQADAGGPYEGMVGEVITFSGSAVDGVSPYTFEWDLDSDGDYDDATGQSASKSWSTIGTYTIGIKVTDDIGTTDTDTAQVSIASQAPNKPSKPSGSTSGKANTDYTYTSSTTDPDGDDVFYLFDWDDGTDSGWLGPYDSGDTVTASHTWTEKGDYQIKVKAKDTHDVESEWSDPLAISMPKNKVINPLILFIERLIERFSILEQILQTNLQ